MGLWANTFGGGNSFTESVANTFTPNDGASYVGGTLTYDSGDNAGQVVPTNSSGGYGTNDSGGAVYSGSANSTSTNAEGAGSSGANPAYTIESGNVKGSAPTGIASFSSTSIIGKIAGWANGLDPKTDTSSIVDGRAVYVNKNKDGTDGMSYSYNFLGMPYEVKVVDGAVMDALKEDANGKFPGQEGYDASTNKYQQMAAAQRAQGNDSEADRILEEEAANGTSSDGSGSGTGELNIENITNMAVQAGLITSNEEINAMIADPIGYFANKGMSLSDLIKTNVTIDPNTEGTSLDPNKEGYMLNGDINLTPETVNTTETITPVVASPTETATADTVANSVANNPLANVNAVTGTVSNAALIDPNENQIDMVGAATGVNADGTTSMVGNALNDYASINTSMIIDTSTVSGKLLAQKLQNSGENYVDAKATILGQMKIISDEFKDSNGNPIIPPWAQGMAREIQRTMAFSGVTGTAATAAMSNAIMEATLGVAEKEASFFQTLTIKNLDNQQESLINKMNILSKFELANLDMRQAALVQNAKHFMEMDMQNLSNEQQAEVLNAQAYVDALFNDQAAINQVRIFNAEQGNDMQMFYDELVFQARRYNSEMINNMSQFNAGVINDTNQWNATMADSRERYNSNMSYQIDVYNADWRQKVTETNATMLYDAYAADVKNAADLNQEGLNRLWDRVDSMLDYYFKGASTEAELDAKVLMAEIAAAASGKGGNDGLWGAIGSLGAAAITKWSDVRLKENIKFHKVINGVNTYTWDWNDEAKRIGADKHSTVGVIAQEIQKTHPDAVVHAPNGYLMVNYGKLQ